MINIANLRKEYRLKTLDINDLNQDPFLQFDQWIQEAHKAKILEWNAMALATCSAQGQPSCRTILLKGVDSRGFLFFTNYDSLKGQDLASHPYACMTFYWKEIERQIIVAGQTEKLTKKESEAYFALRPRGSQIGAWASHQDQIIESREELEQAFFDYEKKYANQTIPMPPYWGGYRLIPNRFEFWQGRLNRLHDRFRYLFQNQIWKMDRLAP